MATNSLKLLYKAGYSTNFNNNVYDSDLLIILNSYKYWETGDMKASRYTIGDSMPVNVA
jgi:hypothetical protein